MRKLLLLAILATTLTSCEKENPEAENACPCKTVRSYTIQVCEGQDWEEASTNALILHEKDSNCK